MDFCIFTPQFKEQDYFGKLENCRRNTKLSKETNTIIFAHFYAHEKVQNVVNFVAGFLSPIK